MSVLSRAPHTDPDSPQHTIRTLCIKTRLWNEDSKFTQRQTDSEEEEIQATKSCPGICVNSQREDSVTGSLQIQSSIGEKCQIITQIIWLLVRAAQC